MVRRLSDSRLGPPPSTPTPTGTNPLHSCSPPKKRGRKNLSKNIKDSSPPLSPKRGRGRPKGSQNKKTKKQLFKQQLPQHHEEEENDEEEEVNGTVPEELEEEYDDEDEDEVMEEEENSSMEEEENSCDSIPKHFNNSSSSTVTTADVKEPLQYKPNKDLMKEIMKEYEKVKTKYDQKVLKDGYDFLHPYDNPSIKRIRVPSSQLKPRAPRMLFSDSVNYKDTNNHTVATLLVSYIQDHPRSPPMRYWTHTNVNIVGKDEHALSHIPYLGDNENDDAGFGEELLNTYDEGIHGEKVGVGKPINDWILFYVVDPILKRHQWKDLADIQRLMISLYDLFPNKNSAREMASAFTDLAQRFDPTNSTSRTKLFDALGEFCSHFSSKVIQSSNASLVCKRCYFVDCMFHPAEITYNDTHIERDDGRILDPDEACGPFCYRHSQIKENKSQKRNSRKRLSSALEVSVCEVLEPLEWTPHEESFIDLLKTGQIHSPCRISQFLSNLSRSSPKTCKQVFDYINGKGPFSPIVFDSNRIDGNSRKLQVAKSQHHRTFRSINGGKLNNQKPYQSCNHAGECSLENGCNCKKQKLMCTKYCGCSTKCSLRFPGCRCKPGNCRTKQCQCYYASWECDPDLCHDCNCQVNEETNLPICRNVCIQRCLQRKLYIGPSEVAGIGCFAEEAIPKGEFIGEYVGEIISQDEAERRGKIYDKFKCSYLFSLNEEQAVDATRIGNIVRFVNHSKHPNCRAKVVVVNGDHHIGLFALNNINPHDELFFDYSYNKSQLSEFVYKERKARHDHSRSYTPDD
uniref:[histone H3]-lysine(27) N-trimethyltransferase n=1 Tax=Panagrolaimus superbus TaxID=310955 RepID=A0A914Z4C8_9BILA